MTAQLKNISAEILNSHDPALEVTSTRQLGIFYSELLNSLNITADSTTFTTIEGGVALSPQHAIDCLEDGVRTSRFLKGIFKAITEVLKTEKDRPLEVLYAGCGPLATLLVPLLPHFNSHQLRITLLDIHEESILSSRRIIEHLELTNFQIDFHICDATKYAHPRKIDLLITETMDKGLTREPQISISEHLCQYLTPKGILIPKEISLYSGSSVFAQLPNHKTHLLTKGTSDLIDYEHFLFSVNRNSRVSFEGFESKVIPRWKNIDSKPDLCIFTEIEVFDDVYLKAGDALITDPICVIFPKLKETIEYSLSYTTKPNPSWSVKQKNGTE